MKRILLRIIYTLIWVSIIFVLVFLNLKSNSVYYAKNMPRGEGQKPEMTMVMDNIHWIDIDNIDGLNFDFDGSVIISNMNDLRISDISDGEYILTVKNIAYILKDEFKVKNIISRPTLEHLKITDEHRNLVETKLKELLAPIIDRQTKPLINLQWIFNWIYEDEFR